MSTNLVIVESPTKARTLSKFLGSKYKIEASMGHVRDLPKSELGVDVEANFEPKYIIPRDKKKKVNELKKIADKAKIIYLATDPDREGEAIAWHLGELLRSSKPKTQSSKVKTDVDLKRVVFHEITESAITEAFKHPRDLDLKLVDAQQARRILDRLVGYKLSPLLWKKVKRGLSAGRVQTVALRLICEREREVGAFKAIEYWSIAAELEVGRVKGKAVSAGRQGESFLAEVVTINSEKLELKEDGQGFFLKSEIEAKTHVSNLEKADYKIEKITQKEVRRQSAPPFTTSTLQQTAGNKLGFTAKKTMMLAQNLYEHGLITYMRTDSFNLSAQAITAARDYIGEKFGKNYLPDSFKVFKSKSKNAQEAHEAIRPTNVNLLSDQISGDGFSRDHKRLYDLIWKRMIACQTNDAVMEQTAVEVVAYPNSSSSNSVIASGAKQSLEIAASTSSPRNDVYGLRASGSVIKFDGWLRVYGVKQLEEESEEEGVKKQVLPKLEESDELDLIQVLPKQHFTEPPPRYTESSLIKKLEELGIGRPSTYAPILSTIQERFYVERVERKFIPTALGFAVSDFLIKYFADVFDYTFTAEMEERLDQISRGERVWKETIAEFYSPFEKKLAGTLESAEHVKLEVEFVDKDCPECGKKLVVRTGKFGKFLACSGFPDCKHTEALEEKIDTKCPQDSGDVVIRKTKKGKTFYGCKNWPKCTFASWTKPK